MTATYIAPAWPHSYFPPRTRQTLNRAVRLRQMSNRVADDAVRYGCDGRFKMALACAKLADIYALQALEAAR